MVAYLVPNLDHEAVREKAVESFFAAKNELYGGHNESAHRTIYVNDDPEDLEDGAYEAKQTPIDRDIKQEILPPAHNDEPIVQQGPADPNICVSCGAKISNGVSNYSIENFGKPYCMTCQRAGKGGVQ